MSNYFKPIPHYREITTRGVRGMGDIIILILMIILAVSKTIEAVLTFNEVCEDRSNNHCNNLNDSSDDFQKDGFLYHGFLLREFASVRLSDTES